MSRDSTRQRDLLAATHAGDVGRVMQLVREGAEIRYRDEKGRTPVHSAAQHGHANILRFFAEREISLDEPDYEAGVTPLMLAVEGCHVSTCKFLLEKAVNVNAVDDKRGYTALHIASVNGHVSIIPLLIKAGADISIQDRSGVLESERIREAFAQGGALIGSLLGIGPPPASVCEAMGRSHVEWGCTAFALAVSKGHTQCVGALMEAGVDVNHSVGANLKPIHSAILRDAEETALFLMSKGADPNTQCDEGFPLRMAIRANMTALAKVIIKQGGNVHIKDKSGFCAIHSVATSGNVTHLHMLMEQHADVDARTSTGASLLHLAASKGQTQLVQALISVKADINARDNNGNTALQLAEGGHHRVVAAFLRHAKAAIDPDSDSDGNRLVDPLRMHNTESGDEESEPEFDMTDATDSFPFFGMPPMFMLGPGGPLMRPVSSPPTTTGVGIRGHGRNNAGSSSTRRGRGRGRGANANSNGSRRGRRGRADTSN